jgi:hypothetical protein
MLPHFVSASTEQVHPGPSIALVVASGTTISSGIGLIVPQPAAGHIPIHLAVRQDAIFPAAAAAQIVLIFTLFFIMGGIMGGLVKARFSTT